MRVADTNFFIRYFRNDEPTLSAQATQVMENKVPLLIPESVFPEIDYILRKKYGVPRQTLVDFFTDLTDQEQLTIEKKVVLGIHIFKAENLDLVDCFVIAHALEQGELISFDKKVQRVFEKLSSTNLR